MKRYSIVSALVVMLAATSARAATALVFAHGTEEQAEAAKADWKNEKLLLERLATVSQPEISTTLYAGQYAVIVGVCEKSDSDALLPMLRALFPTMETKDIDGKGTTCPKSLSNGPTKVVARHEEKAKDATLIVALFEGQWNRGETIQVAVAAVRDKDGDVVDNFSQRAGTILGGETCKAELTTQTTPKKETVVVITRKCEGTSEVETTKLSLLKGRLKQE